MLRLAAIVVALGVSAVAHAQSAREHLTGAIVAFGQRDLERAKTLLDAAQGEASDPSLLALIHRQRGIVYDAQSNKLGALIEFMRAMYFKPELTLSSKEHVGEVVRLWDCAQSFHQQGIKEASVEARHAALFEQSDWTCPTQSQLFASAPPSPDDDGDGGILGSPIFWIAVGAVVVGGAAAGVALANQPGDPYAGNSGVLLTLSE